MTKTEEKKKQMALVKNIGSQKFIKERYYSYYDRNAEKVVTVCLLYKENVVKEVDIYGQLVDVTYYIWSRGLSIVLKGDVYDEAIGNALAKVKAIRGIENKKVKEITYDQAVNVLAGSRCPFTKSSYHKPELTFYEQRLMFKRKWRERYLEMIKPKENKRVYGHRSAVVLMFANAPCITSNMIRCMIEEIRVTKHFGGGVDVRLVT